MVAIVAIVAMTNPYTQLVAFKKEKKFQKARQPQALPSDEDDRNEHEKENKDRVRRVT